MSETRRHNGQFPPGVSGNPGGSPRSAEVSALARRYTVDAVRALVEASRITDHKYASARVAAASRLLELAYPKATEGGGLMDHLHLHLLAVSRGQNAGIVTPHLTGDVEREAVEHRVDALLSVPMLYPEPDDVPPGEALPLWDNYRARKRVIEASAEPPAAENEPETGKSDQEGEP